MMNTNAVIQTNLEQNVLTSTLGRQSSANAADYFEEAINLANVGKVLLSIQVAKQALQTAVASNDYIKVYIYGFLAQQLFECRAIKAADDNCIYAIKSLEVTDTDYEEDFSYLVALLQTIRKCK